MKKEITVDKAIAKGHLVVNVPVFILIIGCPTLAVWLSRKAIIPNWGIGVAFFIGFILAWLVWSFMITKWRLWAFHNVRNVHQLKKRAIEEKLIWNDGNIFERTEIRTRKDKKKLDILEKKFEIEDIFLEDISIPAKTEIRYSKLMSITNIITAILISSVGIYLLIDKSLFIGSVALCIGVYIVFNNYKKILNREPQIIIDSKGIITKTAGFKSWLKIKDEDVILEGYGKSERCYFVYFYNKNNYEKIEVQPLDITPTELKKAIITHRIRSKK